MEESLDVIMTDPVTDDVYDAYQRSRRKINRRDAARAAADALTDESLLKKTVQVWTQLKG